MKHRVVIGIDYEGKRAEPGAIVDDIPAKSVTWLLEQCIIETVTTPEADTKLLGKPREPKSPSKGDE